MMMTKSTPFDSQLYLFQGSTVSIALATTLGPASKQPSTKQEGTWCRTLSSIVELELQQRKFKQTILLDPATSVAIFQTAPAYAKFETFCSILNNPNDDPATFSLHAVTDDEASDIEGSEGDDNSFKND
jgi:hypothetical protein